MCCKLTNEDNDHFLEYEMLRIDGMIHFKHWNKNKNLNKQRYYRGKHFDSVGPVTQKIAMIKSTFTRIARNCSTENLLKEAVQEKIQELTTIGYPEHLTKQIADKLNN